MNLEEYKEPIVNDLAILHDHYGYDISSLTSNDWYQISQLELSEEFMELYKDKIDWDEYFTEWHVDEHVIEKYSEYIKLPKTWESISYNENLSKEFIFKFNEKLDPTILVEHQTVPLKLIKKWAKLPKSGDLIEKVLEYQLITSKTLAFLEKIDFPIDWYNLSKKGRVSKLAFLSFSNSFHWEIISEYRILSELFLKEFKHLVDWKIVSRRQKMSIEFITEMAKYIDIEYLKENEQINQQELEDKGVYVLLKLIQS